jgi:hypothetical protein
MPRRCASIAILVLVVLSAGFIASDLHDHPLGDSQHDRDCSTCKWARSMGAVLGASAPVFSVLGFSLPVVLTASVRVGQQKRFDTSGTRAPPLT